MRRPGLVHAALLALLLLLLDSSKGTLAAPNNGSEALAKAASEKEVLPTPEDPRDADGEDDFFFCSLPSWPMGSTAIGIEPRNGVFLRVIAPTATPGPRKHHK
jgi:hypothetical protein